MSIVSEPDNGQSDAINKGFKESRGQIIGWLNTDDTYLPGAISTATHYLQDNPDVDLVYSDVRVVDKLGHLIGISKSQPFDLWTLVQTSYIKQPTVFMRRKVFECLKGVDENLHYVMDRDLWLRAGLAGFKMCYLEDKCLANFRKCEGTKSYEHGSEFFDEWSWVLSRSLQHPFFDEIDISIKNKFLQKRRSQSYLSAAKVAISKNDQQKMLVNFIHAVKEDSTIVLNKGTWMVFLLGLFGRNVDWRRKYRKSKAK